MGHLKTRSDCFSDDRNDMDLDDGFLGGFEDNEKLQWREHTLALISSLKSVRFLADLLQ